MRMLRPLGLLSLACLATWGLLLPAQSPVARAEFHRTLPLPPRGRVSLENPYGPVHIAGWDRGEVGINAVTTAESKLCLEASEVVVSTNGDAVHIHTRAPHMVSAKFPCRSGAPLVAYEVKVPPQAALDKIATINGEIVVVGIAGFARLNNVNGRISLNGVTGDVKAESVNGAVDATFQRATHYTFSSLISTNGPISVSLPADANLEVSAETSNGSLFNDFGFPVFGALHSDQGFIGTLVNRTALLTLQTVNGSIRVRRLNPVPTRHR